MKQFWQGAILALPLLMAGCSSIGPDYHAPQTAAPVLQGVNPAQESDTAFQARWWTQFGDPTLDTLIRRAVAHNLDVRVALARLAESRARLGITRTDQWPTVQTGLSYSRSDQQQPGFTTQRTLITTYQAGFDASWELDLFGGIRRSVEAANADMQADEARLQEVQISLMAEVARNYFTLRGTQLRLAIAKRGVENQRETLKLTRTRAKIGTGSEQDVASAAARLSAVEARVPLLRAQARASEFRIAVLLGERPGNLDIDLSPSSFHPIATLLPIGNAGDILARRPDVRVAERELAAATARIGVAKADFYPHISLGGFIGFLSGQSSDFGKTDSQAWSLTPSIRWSILNWSRLNARVDESRAGTKAALARYQQTVLLAIEDVDNALVGFNQQRARVKSLMDQTRFSRRASSIARVRYREGAVDFLQLLDAQRTQLAAEDALAQAETAVDTQAVAVYKALGGGWQACGDQHCTALASNP
jgi:multidrug efflux system outer membrane protein